MDELKRCPFCGCEQIDEIHDDFEIGYECYTCGARIDFYCKKEEAIAAWNRRADGWVSVEEIAEIIIQAEDCIKVALDTQDRNYLERVIKQYIQQPPCEIKEYLVDCEDCGFCNPKEGE